jgi:hypothetical protein
MIIKVGDLVRIKEKFVYPNQDVLLLPYDGESIGLVIKVEPASFVFESTYDKSGGVGGSSTFGDYVTVQWTGIKSTLVSNTFQHMAEELQVLHSAEENDND